MPLVLAVIPARYQSTRFPGKVLVPLDDRPLVQCVWQRVADTSGIDRVAIATDDERVVAAAESFGAEVFMTDPAHPTGSDRIGEVVRRLETEGQRFDAIVNVQADEPFVTATALDRLVAGLFEHGADIATLVEPLDDVETLFDPNAVKAVVARDGRALYFSRAPIPYHRGDSARLSADFRETLDASMLGSYRLHQGLYAYRREAFERFVTADPTPLERMEALEQLRALEHGMTIHAVESGLQVRRRRHPGRPCQRARRLMEALR